MHRHIHVRSLSSLRLRLALWYLAVFGVILALFGTLVFVQVRRSLLDGVDQGLVTRAALVQSQLRIGRNGQLTYLGTDAPTAEADQAVYLFDRNGRLHDRVAGSHELPPQQDVLAPALVGRAGYATAGALRLYMTPVGTGRHVQGIVQVVTSLDTVNDQVERLLILLVLAAPALLVVAMAGGIFLAGRALAPIDRIARTARAISAGNLAGRLGLPPRDDEVGRLAATFDDMLDRLERAFAQQRQFTADASHELRTPLTIIKGDLDVLLRRRRAPEEYEEVVRGVNEEVTHLSLLVENLLTLARADSGQAEVARELVSFGALVDDVAAGLRRLAEARGVSLETRIAPDVAVSGDRARLRQLALNLLGNGVLYTPTGGRVQVSLSADAGAGWARLEVSDTGIGIAPEDLPHVFDRFFRADRARARAEGGTGLGLAIVRWCVEAHGGRITVQSRAGEGSVFTVLLPLAMTDSSGERSLSPEISGVHVPVAPVDGVTDRPGIGSYVRQ